MELIVHVYSRSLVIFADFRPLQELSLSAALDREDLAQSYMVADKESRQVGKAHIERFKGSSKL